MASEDERAFWSRWEDHHRHLGLGTTLIIDGIIKPELYSKAKRKILFILKECNAGEGEKQDRELRDFRPACYDKPWHVLGRWAYGIQNDFPTLDNEGSKAERDLFESSFRSAALMNLKKIGGGGSADDNVISAYASLDRELLIEQIEEWIKPEIIVAGGTFKWLIWLFNLSVNPTEFKKRVDWKGRPVINMHHPSFPTDHLKSYKTLRNLLS